MKMPINPVAQTDTTQVTAQAAVANANQTQPSAKEAVPAKPQPAAVDTVTLSSAAKTAAQEATETAAQTAGEANSGDRQAQRMLAKQAAAEEAKEAPAVKSQEAQGTSVLNIK
jgi:hypothetical protein